MVRTRFMDYGVSYTPRQQHVIACKSQPRCYRGFSLLARVPLFFFPEYGPETRTAVEGFCNRKQLPFEKDTFLTILPGSLFTDAMGAAVAFSPSFFLDVFSRRVWFPVSRRSVAIGRRLGSRLINRNAVFVARNAPTYAFSPLRW